MGISTCNGVINFSCSNFTYQFDENMGRLLKISNDNMEIRTTNLLVDIGCDGKFVSGIFRYHDLNPLNTWDLPPIVPNRDINSHWKFVNYKEENDALYLFYCMGQLELIMTYRTECKTIAISCKLINSDKERHIINGIAFMLTVPEVSADSTFEFPCNVPHGVFKIRELEEFKPIETGLVGPIIHSSINEKRFNLFFIDPEEKWGTGVFKGINNSLNYAFMPAVESYLEPGATLECGDLYIQLAGDKDPFKLISDFYEYKGWVAPTDGINDGVMYSCHPFGTMDADFPDRYTAAEYAGQMDAIREMGVDHIWVLPLFEHKNRNVYGTADLEVIDERYGGDASVRVLSGKIHDLGMTLLFDYVPHGPAIDDEFAKDHIHWAAVDRNGNPKIEWEALSYDGADPTYQKYITDVVKDHVKRFGVDGSRIDCAMGGLSNWNPYPGNRPSSSSVKAGVAITRAIREGFLVGGRKPLVLPENFNPVPLYYPYTDVFYDMPLYRVLFELDRGNYSPEEFVSRLTHWLDTQLQCTPKGLSKLRFLGNHDTVSWVWQAGRATKVYGVGKAKALWALMAFIDGMPMIYQGDEDPAIYRGEGPVLRDFFKDIFHARKRLLGNQYDIKYLYADTSVMVFERRYKENKRLVLINFSDKEADYELKYGTAEALFGECNIKRDRVILPGYGYVILNI